MRVYIVRHGETQENRDGIIQGQQDTFLNAIGVEQARMVGEALKDVKFGIAFSSDLSRAVKVRGSDQTRNINHYLFVWRNENNLFCSLLIYCFVFGEFADTRSPGRLLKRYSFITQRSPCTSGKS